MQQQQPAMPVSIMSGQNAQQLLEQISDWGSMTTIVIHGGSVFEFTGPFPKATVAEGFYNLKADGNGFHGHLNLQKVEQISFQTKPHRGRESYAFVFEDANGDVIFKVFLGRDEKGELIASQREKFYQLMQQYQQALK
ncbi:MAG: heme utilization cystosolic carrier protein HutX [Methylophaga sp.]|jgi:heme iron utilization protein|nr:MULTISPECIES: heme utilization cystosolic carrier protein HutX [unclassified Methylophaga]MBL1458574.1 heme utilization cystosolic carrier protein HutX [Methylophaga sp.]|tara:strand:+ start:1129 stop:1542 length:414 start_codon:yes stop_codon:yes gene_type:complete